MKVPPEERIRELESENRNLKEHLEFLRGILGGTEDAVFAKDPAGRHWLVNRSAARVIGRPVSEILGRTVAELFPPALARELEISDRKVMEGGEVLVLEQQFVMEGERRTYLTTKTPHRNAQGKIIGLIGVSRDITERKQAEISLLARTAELAERVKELRCLYSVSTVLGSPELSFEERLRSVAGKIPAGWRYPELARARIRIGEDLYGCEEPFKKPWVLSRELRLGGKAVGVLEVLYPSECESGKDGPFLYEERLLLDEIATRVQELLERKRAAGELMAARERAEAASRLKSEFVGNVSHELRTPLNSILGFADLLIDGVDGALNQEQTASLRRIENNARNLLRLINDMLDLSRIEAARLQLVPGVFSLRGLIGEMCHELREEAQKKGLPLEYHVAPVLPDTLLGDETRLRQVLGNLGQNAIKFTDQGRVSVSVEGTLRDRSIELHCSVTDTGIGIPVDRHDSIFEAFEQVDASITRSYGGAGLGLAICAHLVALMGGRIWVASEPGKGSTFHFTALLKVIDE